VPIQIIYFPDQHGLAWPTLFSSYSYLTAI
jgi:hypothetical protein